MEVNEDKKEGSPVSVYIAQPSTVVDLSYNVSDGGERLADVGYIMHGKK